MTEFRDFLSLRYLKLSLYLPRTEQPPGDAANAQMSSPQVHTPPLTGFLYP